MTTIAGVATKAADANSVASIFGRSPREETRNEATAAPRARTPTVYFVENANPFFFWTQMMQAAWAPWVSGLMGSALPDHHARKHWL